MKLVAVIGQAWSPGALVMTRLKSLAFFRWALENGQTQASELHYVPLPPALVSQVEQYWAAEFKTP
jgi:hypothetical protein